MAGNIDSILQNELWSDESLLSLMSFKRLDERFGSSSRLSSDVSFISTGSCREATLATVSNWVVLDMVCACVLESLVVSSSFSGT